MSFLITRPNLAPRRALLRGKILVADKAVHGTLAHRRNPGSPQMALEHSWNPNGTLRLATGNAPNWARYLAAFGRRSGSDNVIAAPPCNCSAAVAAGHVETNAAARCDVVAGRKDRSNIE